MTVAEKSANIVSYIFHPVFIVTWVVLTFFVFVPLPLYYSFMSSKLFLALFLVIVSYTALIPLLFTFFLYKIKFIQDFTFSPSNKRPYIYLFTSGFYLGIVYFLHSKGNIFYPTEVLLMGIATNILGLFLMNFIDKVSMHSSAMGGVVGIFIGVYFRNPDTQLFTIILLSIVLFGVVSSSRLILGAHNLRQIIIGGFWGLITGFASMYYFLKL